MNIITENVSLFLFSIIVILNVIDVLSTYSRLSKNTHVERNKILLWFIDKLGVLPGIVLPKVIILFLMWLYLPEFPVYLLGGVAVFYTYWLLKDFKKD